MSFESRLARLGLSHLAHDPVALRAETERRIQAYDQPAQTPTPAAKAPEAK